jgi:hypothetical protein
MSPKTQRNKRLFFKGFLSTSVMAVVMLLASFGSVAVATQPVAGFTQFMESSGQWLLSQQRPNGSFPTSVGDPETIFNANIQSAAGLGMLSAWFATDDDDFLDSAQRVADHLINNFDKWSGTGGTQPRIRTFDPLFFIRLSAATNDSTYADFIQANFWDRLSAGTYGGPTRNWDIDDYVASELARRAGPGEVIAAWDLALVAVAAEEAGITTFRSSLAAGAATALGTAPDTVYTLGTEGFDLLGLAGGVWLAAVTGQSVTPAAGPWAGLSTQQLAQQLIAHQANTGGVLQSTLAFTSPVDEVQTVSQITAFAVLALDALNPNVFGTQIRSGLRALIDIFQEPSGRVSYYHPAVDLGAVGDPKPYPYLHAYVMFSVNEGGDEPDPPVPVPMFGAWSLLLLLLLTLSAGWMALALRR